LGVIALLALNQALLGDLPIERREKIEAKAQQMIAEEMSLRSLRKARLLTQEKVAELLDIRQDNVFRIENWLKT
jgi:DNA-binding XRE family transcriptional regulator